MCLAGRSTSWITPGPRRLLGRLTGGVAGGPSGTTEVDSCLSFGLLGRRAMLINECHERRVMIRDAALLCLPGQKCETSRVKKKMEGARIIQGKYQKLTQVWKHTGGLARRSHTARPPHPTVQHISQRGSYPRTHYLLQLPLPITGCLSRQFE